MHIRLTHWFRYQTGVSEAVLKRVFEYWRNIDKEIGARIAKGVQEG